MAEETQLGVFWTERHLCFAQTVGTDLKKVLHVSIGEEARETVKDGPLSQGGMELAFDLQNIVRKENIAASTINLSLSAKEIIFRSFVIPWMQKHEVKSVVEFEASKYIPFSLEELSFSYHPIDIVEDKVRRIRIIFVAIKKEILENYVGILEEASLRVNVIEPAASSLIRALSFKNLIPKDRTIALIEKDDTGRIIIIDKEIPQFVREFHLSESSDDQIEEDPGSIIKKLTREVRISLDYFNRKNEQLMVEKIFLVTASDEKELSQNLEENLDLQITAINSQSVLDEMTHGEIGFLNAYGASIIPSVDSNPYFNHPIKKSKTVKSSASISRKPINYKSIIKTALVCFPLIASSIIASAFLTQQSKQELSVLNEKLGPFQDADVAMIEQQELGLKSKLTYFKKTRMQSDTALFLVLIPDLLPTGIWIKNLDITYDDSEAFTVADDSSANKKPKTGITPNLVITLDGYAYSENKNEQFRLVNRLLKNLKNSKELAGFFQDIDLETTRAQKLDEHSVTSFKILGKQIHDPKRTQ